jgi:hypothetical protein
MVQNQIKEERRVLLMESLATFLPCLTAALLGVKGPLVQNHHWRGAHRPRRGTHSPREPTPMPHPLVANREQHRNCTLPLWKQRLRRHHTLCHPFVLISISELLSFPLPSAPLSSPPYYRNLYPLRHLPYICPSFLLCPFSPLSPPSTPSTGLWNAATRCGRNRFRFIGNSG